MDSVEDIVFHMMAWLLLMPRQILNDEIRKRRRNSHSLSSDLHEHFPFRHDENRNAALHVEVGRRDYVL
ncbi:hypothetical protein AAHA92_21903 [Salvia divinorum]|uniref:Uncharacterized protein n=1 Tax=Salvia divinorum TaxID=28513 RepID=A0ABD1GM94_SALDI